MDKFKQALSDLWKFDKPAVYFAGFVFIGLTWGLYETFKPTSDIRESSVKIVNRAENSGGTGVVIESSPNHSVVLTNGHVCEVLNHGGYVVTKTNKYQAVSFLQSTVSDLCVVHVAANLKTHVIVASSPPKFYDQAIISGHPSLMPNTLTYGHFSGREIITVMTGFKKCTEEDKQGPMSFFCMMLGGIPIVKSYESIHVTATIMSGSSGSGVYNKNEELSGLVFAGSGRNQLSYAWTVPYEQVKNFLDYESKLAPTAINQELTLIHEEEQSASEPNLEALVVRCNEEMAKTDTPMAVKVACNAVLRDMIWRKQ